VKFMQTTQSSLDGVTCADWPTAPAGSVADRLMAAVRDRFGDRAFGVAYLVLVSLSSLSENPVSVQTGFSMAHDEVIRFIEELLGTDRVVALNIVTLAGLLALGEILPKSGCVLIAGLPKSKPAANLVHQLMRGRSVRALDGSHTGCARDRELDRKYTWILLQADDVPNQASHGDLITVNCSRDASALKLNGKRQLAAWVATDQSKGGVDLAIPDPTYLPWSAAVQFPSEIVGVADRCKDEYDLQGVLNLLALSAVWRILKAPPDTLSEVKTVTATREDVAAVLCLIDHANISDHRKRLSQSAINCLDQLQTRGFRDGSIGGGRMVGAKHQHSTIAASGREPFTFYSVQEKVFPGYSIDAVRSWVLELEQAELVCRVGRASRQITFDLTPRGLKWRPGRLADGLRQLLNLPFDTAKSETNSIRLHSPTVGDVVMENVNSVTALTRHPQGTQQ